MRSKFRTLLFAGAFLVAALAAGCGSSTPASLNQPGEQAADKQPGSSVTAPANTETMRVTVYFPTKDAMYLVPVAYTVPKSEHPAKTAMELLLSQPQNSELTKVLPEGTKVLGVTIKDHIAYVDFNDKLIKNNRGGSATELMTVGSIVDTLTEFSDIHKVQILVEGRKIDTISGHMDVGEPLSRSPEIIKKAL
jgi:spore germination protein GerM